MNKNISFITQRKIKDKEDSLIFNTQDLSIYGNIYNIVVYYRKLFLISIYDKYVNVYIKENINVNK